MAGRRAITEQCFLDGEEDDVAPFDLNKLPDSDQPDLYSGGLPPDSEGDGSDFYGAEDSEEEDVDFQNFKGIYFNDDPNSKYTCPESGAHF